MKADTTGWRDAPVRIILKATGALSLFVTLAVSAVHGQTAPLADHHQHLFSDAITRLMPSFPPITASDVISLLDAAGIKRAVLLSVAYMFGRPGRVIENEYEQVKAENDWTGQQAARFPTRLIAFCSFNPLKDYALEELARCAKDPRLRAGVKLHFGNSGVDYHDAQHIERLRQVFRAANDYRMAIVVHMRAAIVYGRDEARTFLNEILPAAPDIPVQLLILPGPDPATRTHWWTMHWGFSWKLSRGAITAPKICTSM